MSDAGRPGWHLRRAGDLQGATDVAASLVTRLLALALDERPRASLALSGGSSPLPMFRTLAAAPLDWSRIDVFQVDERVAPDGHEDRNWTAQRELLLDHVDAPAHPLEVTHPGGPGAGAVASQSTLVEVLGPRPAFDVVHLGMGHDGHVASLFPDAPELDVDDALIVATDRPHAGRHRLSFTYPLLAAARDCVLLVPGQDRAELLRRVLADDRTLPAARLATERVTIVTDADLDAP